MKKVLIYGCGFPGILFHFDYVNSRKKEWEVIGFIDDNLYKKEKSFMGLPVVGDKDSIPEYVNQGVYFFNNIASSTDLIETISKRLKAHDARICTLIGPDAPNLDSSTIEIGEGSHIAPVATLTGPATIGRHVIIRENALVSHDSEIGDFTFIGPGAILMGRIQVGRKTFIGGGAIIKDRVTIGKNCTIAMGSVVFNDVPDNTKVIGNPAKKMPF